MRFSLYTLLLPLLLLLLLGAAPSLSLAQEGNLPHSNATPLPLDDMGEPVDREVPTEVNATLKGLVDAIGQLGESIKAKEEAFREASTEIQRQQLESEISDLTTQLRNRLDNFEDIAAGVDLDEFIPREEQKLDFTQDFQELIAPLLAELKEFTARPRDLERLRAEISRYELLLDRLNAGLARMEKVRDATTSDPVLHLRLGDLIGQWESRRDNTKSALDVAQLKLKEKLADDGSIVSVIQRLFQTFFLTRGKNLLLALLIGGSIFVLMRYSQRVFLRSTRGRTWSKNSMFFRAVTVIYTFVCSIMATFAGLSVLYITGDWVLLGLSALLLIGVIWSAKQNVSNFSEQIKLLCNLGAVREGERVFYEGIPYRVGRINYYTTLYNPLLQGGMVRLHIGDMFDMTSRPTHPDETWFPCSRGDWVMMNDEMYGEVLIQTPEEVILSVWGGNRQHYVASDFLGMKPRNFSSGFGHYIVVGVDYEHQPDATAAIPEQMRQDILAGFEADGSADKVTSLLVEFTEAADSSLNLAIWAAFDGELAPRYYGLGRLIRKLATDSCTRHGWGIPFPQRTVHIASGNNENLHTSTQNGCRADTDVS